jgi:uncharacterized cupredoxin-like copper-binding protein
MRPASVRLVAAGVAAVVLGVVSTLALAALSGAFTRPGLYAAPYPGAAAGQSAGCTVPAPLGRVVEVRVAEMGAMMGGPYRHGSGTGNGYRAGDDAGQPWPPGMGWMDMTVSPTPVKAGEISLLVTNLGWRPHELVVLPLAAGRGVGQRPIMADGRIDETGTLGEASASCAADSGDGILPGTAGWTTLTLAPGRYELVCNYPGHYRGGMYAELDVA